MSYLLFYLIISFAIQLVLFVPAFLFKTDKLTDLSYSLSFIILSLIAFFQNSYSLSKLILLLFICLWGIRLGGYLLVRIHQMKRDKRFDAIRNNVFKFGGFWLLQGITVFLVSINSLIFFNISNPSFNLVSIIGILIWMVGFSIEVIADKQKNTFKNNTQNKDQWIESGLWRYSRHPNYFGEIFLWIGIYIFTLSSLTLIQSLIGLISPLFIACLIIFVSGLPKLEKMAEARWGEDPNYSDYKIRTSILVPWPNRGSKQ
jgi:steroid 5-alpha reductase family enzyme